MDRVQTALAWLSAAVFAIALGASPALTRTISNTAQATWARGQDVYSVLSNTVVIETAPALARIDVLTASADGQEVSFPSPQCGAARDATDDPGSAQVQARLAPASNVRAGEMLYFRIIALEANSHPDAIDRVIALLQSPAGDREEVITFETAANSGEFVGFVRTSSLRSQPIAGNCELTTEPDTFIQIRALPQIGAAAIGASRIEVLAPSYGIVFDSENAAPVNAARVTLVDAATGSPAKVLAEDGVTAWPSTVISGEPVTDGGGKTYPVNPGEYRFPLVTPGRYRLLIEPPPHFSAPSTATAQQLGRLRRPDGLALVLTPASSGGEFTVDEPSSLRADIPLDPAVLPLSLTKVASRRDVLPGDAVVYSITLRNDDPAYEMRDVVVTDKASRALRLKPDSVLVDGQAATGDTALAADGTGFALRMGKLLPGESRSIAYVMTVRATASPGMAINEASASDDRGRSSKAVVPLRILQDGLGSTMTLLGKVVAGSCGAGTPVPGVRIMLEDGSFVITDADGLYHFQGLKPGSHVVRAVPGTLPEGSTFIDCARPGQSAGNAQSRFIFGKGGSLAVADFNVRFPGKYQAALPEQRTLPISPDSGTDERRAAGAETDWLKLGNGPTEFLFPAVDHNPRAPAIRVVIRHKADQKIVLKANGRAVDPVSFDGTNQAPGGRFSVSIWRGIPIGAGMTKLEAEVLNAKGAVEAVLVRDVHFSGGPARIDLYEAKSRLVADGRSPLVLALRIVDRHGRPVRAGSTGEFQLSAPYQTVEMTNSARDGALIGAPRRAPRWFVAGDDGMAYVELAPTMTSGKLSARFPLLDGKVRRESALEAWIVPGAQPWTVIGMAEQGLGGKDRETISNGTSGDEGRIAVYAKGTVREGMLLTVGFDSARKREDRDLMGVIDPRTHYNLFADLSERSFDAPSRDRLYARVEGKGAYAAYGDFQASFDDTELVRFARAATGFQAEIERGKAHLKGFVAEIGSSHRSDRFQGAGIAGPYRLSSRGLIPGSETVRIEVRDRFRSELVASSRVLSRFVDYDLDVLSGTITFSEPVLSRDFELNPRFVIVDYEVSEAAQKGELNGGLRGDVRLAGGRLKIGASLISDRAGHAVERSTLAGLDLKARITDQTELRAELGSTFTAGSRSTAWLVEAEHHSGNLDLLAYARSAHRDFGLGEQRGIEPDWRKLGLDLNYRATQQLSLDARIWEASNLSDSQRRTGLQLGGSWRGETTDARLGLAMMRDSLIDGRMVQSTVIEGGASRRFLGNRLELSASSSIALESTQSVDLPARHRFAARYAITPDLRLVGSYELAKGQAAEARSVQAGVELAPWTGATMKGMLGQRFASETSPSSYATFGIAQSVLLTPSLTVTATLDTNRTLKLDQRGVLDPEHPVSSGGFLNGSGALIEDFNAATLGATWRAGLWSATMRGEWRDSETENRRGMTVGAIRQLGEGSMASAAFTWVSARSAWGASNRITEGMVSLAHRPAASDLALLAKLEFRSDRTQGTALGGSKSMGTGLVAITGDGGADRLIASLSGAWTPHSKVNGELRHRHEVGFFAAVRQNLDQFGGYDLRGTSLLGGLDLRLGLGSRFDLGLAGTLRANVNERTASYAIGPQIGFVPAKDVILSLGYNVAGFHDPDFAAARSTNKGPYVSLRLKFDETILNRVGLGRR